MTDDSGLQSDGPAHDSSVLVACLHNTHTHIDIMLVEFKFDVVLYYKILISEMVFTANLLTSTENNID